MKTHAGRMLPPVYNIVKFTVAETTCFTFRCSLKILPKLTYLES